MKGISLTVETIVIIILAVLVLVAALLLFSGIWSPGQTQIFSEAEMARYCGDYVKLDSQCSGKSVDQNILENIKRIGNNKEYSVCGEGYPNAATSGSDCVKKVCITYCGGGGSGETTSCAPAGTVGEYHCVDESDCNPPLSPVTSDKCNANEACCSS